MIGHRGVGGTADLPSGCTIVEHAAEHSTRCRCGTRISPGSRCVGIRGLPSSLSALLPDREFCSVPCVRAYLQEALEVLEGSAAPTMIRDFHEVYSSLQTAFTYADFAASSGSTGSTRHPL